MDHTTVPTIPLVATIKFFHSDPALLPTARTDAQLRAFRKMAMIEQAMGNDARRYVPQPPLTTHAAYPSKLTL